MKKVFLCFVFILTVTVMITGLFMIFNGSMEMFPTDEQMEKVRITGEVLLMTGVVANGFLVAMMLKNRGK